MADVKDQDDSIICDEIEEASEVLDTKQADRVVPETFKKRNATVPLSPSAQDSRCLDVEKEKNDGNSSGGFVEGSEGNPQAIIGYRINRVESNIKSPSLWKKMHKLREKRSFKCLASFPICGLPKMASTKCCTIGGNPNDFVPPVKYFTLSDLHAATNNFSDENIVGKGGYAEVYRGCLKDGTLIAVKQLTKGTPDEITERFLIEFGISAQVDHPNIAKLIGYCIEEGMHLVFHLSPHGCLGSHLQGSEGKPLDWSKRYKIAVGAAKGLAYLHEYCPRRIIHRDIKADNILLKEDFEPQICDFGLSIWLPSELTHHNISNYEGTPGYLAPEYIIHGMVNEKTDVYAFGILLLEITSGRVASNKSSEGLLLWAKPLLDNNDVKALLDPALGEEYNLEEVNRMLLTASLCVDHSPILRPRMSQAVTLLRGDENTLACKWISEADYPEGTLGRALATT